MTVLSLTIPAAWVPAAVKSLREAYGETAQSVSRHIADGGTWSQQEAAKLRVRAHELENALDQLDWSEEQRDRDARLAASDRALGIALNGALAAASWEMGSCWHPEVKFLYDERLSQLALMIASLDVTDGLLVLTRLPRRDADRLQEHTDAAGLSTHEAVRAALDSYLKRRRAPRRQ